MLVCLDNQAVENLYKAAKAIAKWNALDGLNDAIKEFEINCSEED